MGAGKTTIGQLLAQKTQLELIDLDQKIVAETGLAVPELFKRYGEAGFRRLETKALQQSLQQDVILATGGGIVTQAVNRQLLTASTLPVVYLQADPGVLYQRVHGDHNRPNAQNVDLAGFTDLAQQRQAFYQEVSDVAITTAQATPLMVVTRIMAACARRASKTMIVKY